MTFENVLYEVRNKVAYITLNRPERRNALSEPMMADIEAAVEKADNDQGVKCLVVKGTGQAFCSGYDLGGFDPHAEEAGTDEPPLALLLKGMYMLRRNGDWWMKVFWNMKKPVIAQVHGYCLAGGNDLAGVCDLIYAADDAQFGMPQARALGIPHTFGLLPLTIGMRRSKEMAFTGDTVTGREAERLGMINHAVPGDELDEAVTRMAERVALMPMEMLMVNKWGINRFYEIMGVDAMVRSTNEWDAIASHNSRFAEFVRIVGEEGLKAALTWRDAPWNDYDSGQGRTPVS